MKIDAIYIACFKHDVHFTRILVASIRSWYPDLPISLIKDRRYGDFGTREIEKHWNVSLFPTTQTAFGWGFGKLEPLFLTKRRRVLILDSDIVFVGPVLRRLEAYDEEFIVQFEEPTPEFVESNYFALTSLKAKLDNNFEFPGFTFNTGQFVATTGVLTRGDFDPFVDWRIPPVLRFPEIFKLGEQGLLNYVLIKKKQGGQTSLRRVPFMEVGSNQAVSQISVSEMESNSPYEFLVHWCGLRKPKIEEMARGDLLE